MKKILLLLSVWLTFGVSAQDFSYPADIVKPTYQRTSFQKGIGISTDVALVAMPVATLTGVIVNQDWQGLKQVGFTAAATVGTLLILKFSVHEMRPDMSNDHSFPSGHAAIMFANAAFLQRRYGWKFGAPAYALATYTAVGRVLAKKHHWWDVVAGAAIGAGSAYIFTTPWARRHEFSMAPVATDTGMAITAQMTF